MSCIFCMIADGEIPSKKLYEDDKCLVILDLSQTTRGHSLVICKDHYPSILEVDEDILAHMIKVTKSMSNKIKETLNASGINILSNAKVAAGQTVDHFHIHIIPRYDKTDGIEINFTNNQDQFDLDEIKKLF